MIMRKFSFIVKYILFNFRTTTGQVAFMFYAITGIPITMLFLASIGENYFMFYAITGIPITMLFLASIGENYLCFTP